MKRLLLASLAILLLTAPEASAVCQTCNNNGTLAAQCWVVGPCDMALYAACWVRENFENNEIVSRQCVGSPAGSDCNRPAGYCSGGGDDPGGGGAGGGDGCSLGPSGCPAYCSSCDSNDWP